MSHDTKRKQPAEVAAAPPGRIRRRARNPDECLERGETPAPFVINCPFQVRTRSGRVIFEVGLAHDGEAYARLFSPRGIGSVELDSGADGRGGAVMVNDASGSLGAEILGGNDCQGGTDGRQISVAGQDGFARAALTCGLEGYGVLMLASGEDGAYYAECRAPEAEQEAPGE